MNDSVKAYIGKDCLIYTLDSQMGGIVTSVADNWMTVDNNGSVELVNLDYVKRIREYPLNKNGKRKTLVSD